MAPEQIECEEIDERTDVYSFGIMAYEIATGSRPFPQKNVSAVFRAHRETPVPDPRFRKPDLPEKFHNFIQKCTQKEPANRYRNFEEVLEDLQGLAAEKGLSERIPERRARKVMSILMTYPGEKQVELAKLVGGFAEELKLLGAKVHIGDFQDI